MPVRVIKYKSGQYKLQCQHGRLAGRYQGGQLNAVDQSTADIFSGSIHPAPKKKGKKDVTISFAKAVAQENQRGSITSAQKSSRVTKALAAKASKASKASGLKQGTKRRRTTEEEVIDDTAGPGEPVQGVKCQRRGRGLVPVPEPTQAPRLRRRG